MQKVTDALFSLKEAIVSFAQGFVAKCFLIFIVDEVKNFAANIFFKLVCQSCTGSHASLVSHVLGSVQKRWHSYIEEFRGSEAVEVSTISSSTGIVESRDKGFVLDLKFLFTIVNCFSERFSPKFFTVKLVYFIGFLGLSYLVLFIFPLHDFDMILMLFVLTRFIHNKSN